MRWAVAVVGLLGVVGCAGAAPGGVTADGGAGDADGARRAPDAARALDAGAPEAGGAGGAGGAVDAAAYAPDATDVMDHGEGEAGASDAGPEVAGQDATDAAQGADSTDAADAAPPAPTCTDGCPAEACAPGGACGACSTCDGPMGCGGTSFEDGQLGGVSTSGERLPFFGNAGPTDGERLLKLGAGGSLTVTLCVDAGTHTVAIDWRYLSEQLLEWCGSGYQNPFEISLEWESGKFTLLYVSVDAVCPPARCSGCGGQYVGLEPSPATLGQGDVLQTPWHTSWATFALPAASPVTLKAFMPGAGDTIYESAALLDHLRIDGCIPDCYGKQCGANGCGLSCGSCGEGEACYANQCKP